MTDREQVKMLLRQRNIYSYKVHTAIADLKRIEDEIKQQDPELVKEVSVELFNETVNETVNKLKGIK